jgi:hypothetical protein
MHSDEAMKNAVDNLTPKEVMQKLVLSFDLLAMGAVELKDPSLRAALLTLNLAVATTALWKGDKPADQLMTIREAWGVGHEELAKSVEYLDAATKLLKETAPPCGWCGQPIWHNEWCLEKEPASPETPRRKICGICIDRAHEEEMDTRDERKTGDDIDEDEDDETGEAQ